jgi:hypothetical protein
MTNRCFFTDLGNPDLLEYLKCYMTQVSFNSYNARYYFHDCKTIFCTKNMHICNSHDIYFVAYELYIFMKNDVLNMLRK